MNRYALSDVYCKTILECFVCFASFQERMRTRSESALITQHQLHPMSHSLPVSTSSSSFHIVHIDTKYVTGFSDSAIQSQSASETCPDASKVVNDDVFLDQSKDYRNPPENLDSTIRRNRKVRLLKNIQEDIAARNRRILARKRAKQPYEVPWRLTQSFQENLLQRQSDIPESKSNSSSPVKPVNAESLTRSRSLDNIDFSSFFISESGDKQDIDNVASGIKNINFSDS